MKKRMAFVDYQESLSIKVGKWLLQKEFYPADHSGMATQSLVQTDELGILWRDPEAKPRKYLFGLIKQEPRRGFIGTVWFSNSARGANEQNWLFEMYGRKHIELVRQLTEEMSSSFNVKISLRLVREQPDVETYPGESDYD